LDAKRDWGYAPDYVEAIWIMLQQEKPDDYLIASGESHSVGEFVELAFARAGLNWKDYVIHDPRFIRPAEVDCLVGDASKAAATLGWRPKTSFLELVNLMTDYELHAQGLL